MSVEALAGRYRVMRLLGPGGMGAVHLAHDAELDRPVAIKLLAEHLAGDEELRRRFVREAKLAARLAHPNVVAVFDAGEAEGRPYIVMEYVEGETLADVVRREGPLPPAQVVELALQACAGLENAHRAGLVHRDVKPQNLLLGRDGQLKIADFGIARAVEGTRLTEVGTVLGTAAYMAPEQAAGEEVTPAADLYAVGACLYELLAGEPPARFAADFLPREPRRLGEVAPHVPAELERLVMRCLEVEPARRPPSAGDLAAELATALAEPVSTESRTARTHVLAGEAIESRIARRLVVAAFLVAVAITGAIAVLAFALSNDGDGGQAPPRVQPVPDGPTPSEDARNLADWLRERARR